MKFECSACGRAFVRAWQLHEHLVKVHEWELEAAYIRCEQLVYPEEWAPDAEGVLRRLPAPVAER